METNNNLKRAISTLIFDQYGTIVDIQSGLTEAVSQFLKDKGFSLIAEKFKDEYPKTLKHLISLDKRKEFSTVLGTYLDWYKSKLQITRK